MVKEFHSEDAATAVSETPQESDSVVAATMASHHADHRHWAERVKREREMERKFHGKGSSRSKGKADHGRANAGDEEEEDAAEADTEAAAAAAAAARKKRKPMVTTVPWRRPGPYEKGVVHEDVLQLEVESSEAESQGARTRAGLEQVYLSSGDIPCTPAEPDAASFLPVGAHKTCTLCVCVHLSLCLSSLSLSSLSLSLSFSPSLSMSSSISLSSAVVVAPSLSLSLFFTVLLCSRFVFRQHDVYRIFVN